ncbi:unnamed protein product, partial [Ascophyllum nodosum]
SRRRVLRITLVVPNRRFHQMYGVAENACCRTTVSKSGVPYHREGGRYDSEPERSQREAVEDDDSPTTTITCLCTNGKEG